MASTIFAVAEPPSMLAEAPLQTGGAHPVTNIPILKAFGAWYLKFHATHVHHEKGTEISAFPAPTGYATYMAAIAYNRDRVLEIAI